MFVMKERGLGLIQKVGVHWCALPSNLNISGYTVPFSQLPPYLGPPVYGLTLAIKYLSHIFPSS